MDDLDLSWASPVAVLSSADAYKFPLIDACVHGNREAVVAEIQSDKGKLSDLLRQATSRGLTALYCACCNGHDSICSLLLEHPELELDGATNSKRTALFAACANGHKKIVGMLLERGADLKTTDRDGHTVFHAALAAAAAAAAAGTADPIDNTAGGVLDMLLEANMVLAEQGRVRDHVMLLSRADHSGLTALHYAVLLSNPEACEELLTQGVDLNPTDARGRTPLSFACQTGQEALVETFLSLMQPDEEEDEEAEDEEVPAGRKNPQSPVSRRSPGFYWQLDEDGVSILDTGGRSPLHYAAAAGSRVIVEMLSIAGADIDLADHQGMTGLHFAALNGHVSVVQLLLEDLHANPMPRDKHGRGAIHAAACSPLGAVCVAFLVNSDQRGLRDASKSEFLILVECSGWTALHWAASLGHKDNLDLLLVSGANQDAVDRAGRTALHLCCHQGHHKCVKALQEAGANASLPDRAGNLPLHNACSQGRLEVVQELLPSCGVEMLLQQNKSGATPMHLACVNGYPAALQTLLSRLQEPGAVFALYSLTNGLGRSLLHEAARGGSAECLKLLLGHFINVRQGGDEACNELVKLMLLPDSRRGSVLHYAARHSETFEALSVLVSASRLADLPDKIGRTALHYAARDLDIEWGRGLLELETCKPSPRDATGQTPLHLACLMGDSGFVEMLLKAGAAIGSKDSRGRTALHAGCAAGSEKVVEVLLEHGADLGVRDQAGITPFACACGGMPEQASEIDLEHRLALIELLLANGADPNLADASGCTSLHRAVLAGRVAVVRQLLGSGAELKSSQKTAASSTALHLAIQMQPSASQTELVVLLASAASRDLCDQQGRTGLHAAALAGRPALLRQLLELGTLDSSAKDYRQQKTCLHAVAFSAQPIESSAACAKLLLCANPALARSVDGRGRTPLHLFCMQGKPELVQLVLRLAPNAVIVMNLCDADGQTALHKAAAGGHLRCLKPLLELGADPDVQDRFGATALLYASKQGHPEVVKLLLRHQADESLVDSVKHRSPRQWADAARHPDCLQLLAVEPIAVIRPDSLPASSRTVPQRWQDKFASLGRLVFGSGRLRLSSNNRELVISLPDDHGDACESLLRDLQEIWRNHQDQAGDDQDQRPITIVNWLQKLRAYCGAEKPHHSSLVEPSYTPVNVWQIAAYADLRSCRSPRQTPHDLHQEHTQLNLPRNSVLEDLGQHL